MAFFSKKQKRAMRDRKKKKLKKIKAKNDGTGELPAGFVPTDDAGAAITAAAAVSPTKRKGRSDDVGKDGVDAGAALRRAGPKRARHGDGDDGARAEASAFPRINDILERKRLADVVEKRQKRDEKRSKKTLADPPDEEKIRYVALDCEMVGTGPSGKRSVLARASLTSWDGSVLLDTYVTVPERVTDFRTWVSGVAPKHLNSAKAISQDECRVAVGKILAGKILVGHALHNDLKALALDHPRPMRRDTAAFGPFMKEGRDGKRRPRKLRDLAEEKVGLTIQAEGEAHSSVDDANAAMELYRSVWKEWEREVKGKGKGRGGSASRGASKKRKAVDGGGAGEE